MALGSLPSLTEINTELGTSGQKLSTCIDNAGKTGTWGKQSDFSEYSHLYLTVNKSAIGFDDAGIPSQSFTITSNTNWTVSDNQSWITWDGNSTGSGNHTKNVECIDNLGAYRTGVITIAWSGTDRTINITQLEGS